MTGNACGRTGFRSCGGRTEGSAGHLPLEESRYEDRDRFGPLRVLLTGLSAFLEPSPDTLTDLPRNLIGFIDNFAGTFGNQLRRPGISRRRLLGIPAITLHFPAVILDNFSNNSVDSPSDTFKLLLIPFGRIVSPGSATHLLRGHMAAAVQQDQAESQPKQYPRFHVSHPDFRYGTSNRQRKGRDQNVHPWTDFATFEEQGSLVVAQFEGCPVHDSDGARYLGRRLRGQTMNSPVCDYRSLITLLVSSLPPPRSAAAPRNGPTRSTILPDPRH